jgi:hypothetical protein
MPLRDSNPYSQQASGRRPTLKRRGHWVRICISYYYMFYSFITTPHMETTDPLGQAGCAIKHDICHTINKFPTVMETEVLLH